MFLSMDEIEKESSIGRGSYNVIKWRKLETGVCISLHFDWMQDGKEADAKTNAECDAIEVFYWGTNWMIQFAAVTREWQWRKAKGKTLVLRKIG